MMVTALQSYHWPKAESVLWGGFWHLSAPVKPSPRPHTGRARPPKPPEALPTPAAIISFWALHRRSVMETQRATQLDHQRRSSLSAFAQSHCLGILPSEQSPVPETRHDSFPHPQPSQLKLRPTSLTGSWGCIFISSGHITRAQSQGPCRLILLRNNPSVFQSDGHSHQRDTGSDGPTPSQTPPGPGLLVLATLTCVRRGRTMALIHVLWTTNNNEHFSQVVVSHPYMFFDEVSVQSAHWRVLFSYHLFSYWVSVVHYLVWMQVLHDRWFANIVSYFVTCLFILLIVYCKEQRFSVLVKPNSSLFFSYGSWF